jgi:glycerate kinase
MRVVVVPDKFKGSLTAVEAAEAIGEGLRQGSAEVDVVLAPVADGGDGTVDAAVAAGYDRVTTTTTGPTGEPVTASFAVSDDTAQLVITGEGSLDLQSLAGKAPWGVAKASAHAGVPVVALVGRSALEDEEARAAGFAEVHTLTHLEPDRERCHREASALLVLLARRLAQTSPLFGATGAAPADSAKS